MFLLKCAAQISQKIEHSNTRRKRVTRFSGVHRCASGNADSDNYDDGGGNNDNDNDNDNNDDDNDNNDNDNDNDNNDDDNYDDGGGNSDNDNDNDNNDDGGGASRAKRARVQGSLDTCAMARSTVQSSGLPTTPSASMFRLYTGSLTIGNPRCWRCTRIWCILPVRGVHRTTLVPSRLTCINSNEVSHDLPVRHMSVVGCT
jgi:hypothetical protein